MSAASTYAETVLAIRSLEAIRDGLKAEAMAEIAELGGEMLFEGPDGKIKLEVKAGRESLDGPALLDAHPDLYDRVCEAKPSLKLFRAVMAMGVEGVDEDLSRYVKRGDDFLQLRSL